MSLIGDITNLVLGVSGLLQLADETVTNGRQLSENIRLEYGHLKSLKFDPKFKNRVINAPKAIEQTRSFVQNLVGEVSDAFHSLISNLRAITGIAHEVGGLGTEKSGQGVIHILNDITKLKNFIGEINQFFQSLNSFVESLRKIRDELETLDTLFLQQGNSRALLRLQNGDAIKIRLGSLHQL